MSIRAKFQCNTKTPNPPGQGGQVALNAVYEGEGGVNKSWSQWTPSGSIAMHVTNQTAYDAFELNGYYFVDFTPTTRE
jgi:hypothetical protein